ncbi:glycosyltransferase [Patescibacteria group bacterium]|nr:glycosyltransferase [Patescibacteria group bacterium]MBU1674040.1 glycosyltransferase [Patescibacteria group bacterium]MBU1963188.1 glycosyltransferase [Patescibacteria group bacterium]
MRLLIVHDTFYPNVDGASYFTQRLAHKMADRGHEVMVIAPGQKFQSYHDSLKKLKVFWVMSVPILVANYRFSFPYIHGNAIKKVVAEFDPEVIHFQGHFPINASVHRAARALHKATVGTNHFMPDNLAHYLPAERYLRPAFENIAWGYFKKMFEQLDIVTTPTQTAADVLKKIGLQNEVRPVSCGIDMNKFSMKKSTAEVKEKYNIKNKFTAIYVGRMDKDKSIDIVIKAMPAVLKEKDIQVILVGKGKESENLKKLARKLGVEENVIFAGFVPDDELPNFYNMADCAIAPGNFELQSISTMEAMSMGLPVVAVNALALPELVHAGENGFLFAPGDSRQLAEYLLKMINDGDMRESMGIKSLEIIKKHDIERSLDCFEDIYKEAINKKQI